MHKYLLNFFTIVWFLLLNDPCYAQISQEPIRHTGPVYQVAPLPAHTTPDDIKKPDPSEKEEKNQVRLQAPGPGKQGIVKQSGEGQEQKTTPPPVVETNKQGTVVKVYTPEEKASWSEADHAAYQQSNVLPRNTSAADDIIIPDLQVTATPESPEIQVFSGTEKLPEKFNKEKTEETDFTEKTENTQHSKPGIGKVDFLKQYAADLKNQIEKNKKNAQYPHAAKTQELEALEQLLKQAE